MPIGLALGTAAVGIGGAVLSSSSQKKAAKTAADAQITVANQNNALQRELYGYNTANFSPYMETGRQAMGTLNGLLAGDSGAWDSFRNSTNYQFRLNEGNNSLGQGWAGQGAYRSGAAAKDAIQYNQNFASNELGNYTNLLQGQQNLGFGSAQALAGVSNNYGNNVTANNNNAANATSNAALLSGQANSNMYSGIASSLGGLAGYFSSSYGK